MLLRANYSHGLTSFEYVKCVYVMLPLQLLHNYDNKAYEQECVKFNALLTAVGVWLAKFTFRPLWHKGN